MNNSDMTGIGKKNRQDMDMAVLSEQVESEKQVRDLQEILTLTNAIAAEKNIDVLLKMIMEGATRVMEADVSSIFLCDYDTRELYIRFAQNTDIKEIRLPMDKGIAGSVATTRRSINIEDAYKDSRFNPEVDRKTRYRTRSILCMPLINRKNEVLGVTQVLNKKNGRFTRYDEKLLGLFSLQAAISVENALMAEENETLFKSLIQTLAKTIDARDPVTAGHSQRVALYADRLARAYGLDDTARYELEVASFLHDVGKIGVRDDVLLKPGRLSREEFSKIQEHAAYTSEILEQIHFSRKLQNVPFLASAHHERVDGKGYPYQLTEETLPLAARILSIVDVYDALTAYDRPYKNAMPVEKALSILEQGRGTQFDARLVDLFIREKCYNIERRQHRRISVDLEFEITFLSSDDQARYAEKYAPTATTVARVTTVQKPGVPDPEIIDEKHIRVKDISISGMQFETGYFFPVNNYIILNIMIKQISLSVLSRVVRVRHRPVGTGYIMGVEFMNMTIIERRRLLHYIDSLSTDEKQAPIQFH